MPNLCIHDYTVAAGEEWLDSDDVWRVVLVAAGSVYWLGHHAATEVNSGDVIAIGPASRGVLRASRIGNARLHYFNFAPQQLTGLVSLTERLSLEALAKSEFVRVFVASDRIACDFRELVAANVRHRPLLQRCRILNLVGLIFGDVMPAANAPSLAPLGTSELRFEQVIDRLSDADLLNHAPEKLAAMCGCSPRHFRRLFRKRFHTSIRARQTELRLEQARQLLAGTNEKIAAIALESGYRHLGFFNAVFKKRFGMTPSEWRRLNSLSKEHERIKTREIASV